MPRPSPKGRVGHFRSDAACAHFLATYDLCLAELPPYDETFDIPTGFGTVRVYRFAGPDARPVVLLPGRNASTPMWGANLDGLLAHRTVFTVDLLGEPLLGAVLFPVGFCMLHLLGFDLLTGVFTLVPLAWLDKRPGVTIGSLLRNGGLVFVGNFAGALTVAAFMAVYFTYGFAVEPDAVGQAIGAIGQGRTVGYAEHGAAGMLTLFLRGVMCNWMVSTGVVGAMMSDSLPGKVIAMWMPIMVFFYLGFEHSIVNMFLFPSGLLLGGDFTIGDYLLWNEIPTVLGNLVGGLAFVGLVIYATHAKTAPLRPRPTDLVSVERIPVPNTA